MSEQPIYLDCAASTPMEPEVIDFIAHHLKNTWGNPHSRTHEYGTNARQLVENARESVANVVGAKPSQVTFTSGATEANNLAIQSLLGINSAAKPIHILSSKIEHASVIRPLEELERRGATIEMLDVLPSGQIDVVDLEKRVREETALVSVMQVNSETGIKQPIDEIAEVLSAHSCLLHTDAAQGFGKDLDTLRNPRIDLISCSSHKLFGPKGVGALIAKGDHSLRPMLFGGQQERGLRSGTVPAPLVGGFGLACEIAVRDADSRSLACQRMRDNFIRFLEKIPHVLNGNPSLGLTSTINASILGIDSEALMIALRDHASLSNGSACSSGKMEESATLKAMGITGERASGAVRFSWCHLTPEPDWESMTSRIQMFL